VTFHIRKNKVYNFFHISLALIFHDALFSE